MVTMSLRLTDDQNDALEAVANAKGTSKTDVIRSAVDQYIGGLKTDDEFKAALLAAHARHQRAMELLA